MEKYTYQELADMRNRSESVWKKAAEIREANMSIADKDIREFAEDIRKNTHGSRLYKIAEKETGEGVKPSVVIEKYFGGLFNGIIFPRRKECVLYIADNIHKWAYEKHNLCRRSFHTSDAGVLWNNIRFELMRFINDDRLDKDYIDILKLNVSEDERNYIIGSNFSALRSSVIAYEIDRGNKEFIEEIKNVINGESGADISYDIILGVFKSSNRELHKYMGQLLLAARLQEGLRQAICENADMGTVEGFLEIVKVIRENDLVRFSSVKRAMAVWTGLAGNYYEMRSSDLERIPKKLDELVYNALTDEKIREEYLHSEDSMKIYTALWAYGVFETKDAVAKIKQLSESGTHHQILAAGYAAQNLCECRFEHEVSKYIIEKHTEQDILAMYIPIFMSGFMDNTVKISFNSDSEMEITMYDSLIYFSDKAEALKYYNILKNIYSGVKGKYVEFSPCVFSWHSARLTKEALAERIIWLAKALDDEEKTDEALDYIGDVDGLRRRMVSMLLSEPKTKKQQRVLTQMVCDKQEFARNAAYGIIRNTEISDENYLLIEDMLKYKDAEMRSNLISLLMKRDDDKLYDAIARLVSDKKEEKRTAALDMILQLGKNGKRSDLYGKCCKLVAETVFITSKEKILAEQIAPTDAAPEAAPEPLYDESDTYSPTIDTEYIKKAKAVFEKYFYHKSFIDKLKSKRQDFEVVTEKLVKLIEEHGADEYISISGETATLSSGQLYVRKDKDGNTTIAFSELWDSFYESEICTPVLAFRAYSAILSEGDFDEYSVKCGKIIKNIMGGEFTHGKLIPEMEKVMEILRYYVIKHCDKNELRLVAAYTAFMLSKEKDLTAEYKSRNWRGQVENHTGTVARCYQLKLLLSPLENSTEDIKQLFPILYTLENTKGYQTAEMNMHNGRSRLFFKMVHGFDSLYAVDYIRAAYYGVISEGYMYKWFMSHLENRNNPKYGVLNFLSNIARAVKDVNSSVTGRSAVAPFWATKALTTLTGKAKPEDFDDNDKALVNFAYKAYERLIAVVLYEELRRGDTPTRFSEDIGRICRIYGTDYYVKILTALGKEPLNRFSCYYSHYSTKRNCLSHLLSVCVPESDDNAEKLKALISGTDITEERLIEAAMYSPEWLDITEEYLGWNGFKSACYYFMAHMNESFDNKREAVITKYSPVSIQDLHNGAFDVDWFKTAYEALGEKRFNLIYKAAKYISDGSKHTRARKYADAALGKLKADETKTQITDKRNKDLLMAYAIIPLKDDKDMLERYLYLQQFQKESRKFGSQRSTSEKVAVEAAMKNLATNAGYGDVTRLVLRMETKLIEENRPLLTDREVGDVTVRLGIDENGRTDIICTKDGKRLKSIPARLKKDEYITLLTKTKKNFNEQYSRTRRMFEESMEDGTEYTFGEIRLLLNNPVVAPIIRSLVYISGNKSGYISENGIKDYNDESFVLSDNDILKVAHPFNLYSEKSWVGYQQDLFARGVVQPFRQVFRELYVKTSEELEMLYSLRYAGNQIQPKKTVACLKTRRWTADIEDGLQKVYYKDNITARIFARADWFAPSDIEAPTLEWVEFSDRLTGQLLEIKEIPGVVFSEVMRDVDLAVSVAHAGGVDPETSHSTVEMRAALLGFTLPLFKLTNVEIKGSHAHITGKRADYTLHLGSGVVHQKGGTMISILPVHSQHRGKLFLPFADDDPKTAEIISKVLLMADDSKIKDPSILAQINR